MGLEQRIEELKQAIVALTETVQKANTSPVVMTSVAPAAAASALAPEKRMAAAPQDEIAEAETSAPAEKPLAYEDLTQALVKLGKHLGAAGKTPKEVRETGIACLARVGAEKLPDLKDKPESWPRLIAVIESVMDGGEP
jgi:ribosomal protein L1